MRLLALLLLALPAVADRDLPTFECKRPHCLMTSEAELDALIDTNNRNYDRAMAAEQRVKELEASGPRCAKTEVTEPPKRQVPPLKKERDS